MAPPTKKKEDYPCGRCDRVFKSKQALGNHLTRTHKQGRKTTTRRASSNGRHTEEKENLSSHVHYLFGKVETIIEYYASSNGVPKSALAEGIAGLLRH